MVTLVQLRLWWENRKLRKENRVKIPHKGVVYDVDLTPHKQEEEPPWQAKE